MSSKMFNIGTKLTRHFAHHQWGTARCVEMVGNAALSPTLPGYVGWVERSETQQTYLFFSELKI